MRHLVWAGKMLRRRARKSGGVERIYVRRSLIHFRSPLAAGSCNKFFGRSLHRF